jgi:CBS domain-containing protein
MQVQQVMNQPAIVCRPQDTTDVAVRLMGENDCGVLPVVDADDKVIGMVTDRDICMAAYLGRSPLHTMTVMTAMSEQVAVCGPKDSLDIAAARMQRARVHRLPVVDETNTIVGVISTNDIFRQVNTHRGQQSLSDRRLVEMLAAICAPHRPVDLVSQST